MLEALGRAIGVDDLREVVIGPGEGLKHDSAVNLDHVQTVETARLRSRVGRLGQEKMAEVCRALAIATGCR